MHTQRFELWPLAGLRPERSVLDHSTKCAVIFNTIILSKLYKFPNNFNKLNNLMIK